MSLERQVNVLDKRVAAAIEAAIDKVALRCPRDERWHVRAIEEAFVTLTVVGGRDWSGRGIPTNWEYLGPTEGMGGPLYQYSTILDGVASTGPDEKAVSEEAERRLCQLLDSLGLPLL